MIFKNYKFKLLNSMFSQNSGFYKKCLNERIYLCYKNRFIVIIVPTPLFQEYTHIHIYSLAYIQTSDIRTGNTYKIDSDVISARTGHLVMGFLEENSR